MKRHHKAFAFVTLILLAASCTLTKKTDIANGTPHTLSPESDEFELSQFLNTYYQGNTAPLRTFASEDAKEEIKDYAPGKIFSFLSDPALMQALETRGFYFPLHLNLDGSKDMTTADLQSQSTQFSSLTSVLKTDLVDLTALEKKFKGDKAVGIGMGFSHRIFDGGWFNSKKANLQLVGVINRLDRVAFNPNSCGELRFIYRMGYDDEKSDVQSRLPFTFLVKYMVRGKSHPSSDWDLCKRMVSMWTYPEEKMNREKLADWIVSNSGPLAQEFIMDFHSIEVNFQAVRYPSSMRKEFGGHAAYLLRVFKRQDQQMVPLALENTPDVDRILADPALHAELKALMKDRRVVNRIDNGIWNLPEKFAAYRAYSYSPMGLDRRDNRLFSKLIEEKDFNPAHFNLKPKFVFTPAAAITRLNDLSCVGCHQGRGIAGFHFLGVDRLDNHDFNSLIFEGSGHFQIETKRRLAYLGRVQRNLVPDPGRDFSFSPADGKNAGYADFCGLKDSKSYSHWTCRDGMDCVKIDGIPGEAELGRCFPKSRPAGTAAYSGIVTQDDHHRDKLTDVVELQCGKKGSGYGRSIIGGGFPSGMCRTSCGKLDPQYEICAHIAGAGFTDCLAKGKPFEDCLDGSSKSGRGLCNNDLACRNDYVCSRTFGSKGNCTPSYFMFQLRLDGHTKPI